MIVTYWSSQLPAGYNNVPISSLLALPPAHVAHKKKFTRIMQFRLKTHNFFHKNSITEILFQTALGKICNIKLIVQKPMKFYIFLCCKNWKIESNG